jgi:hypothetical protein
MTEHSFPIEKGIPAPSPKRRNYRYPFAEMEVGDSFVATSNTVRSAASTYSRRHKDKDICFVCTKQEDGRIRVWRYA